MYIHYLLSKAVVPRYASLFEAARPRLLAGGRHGTSVGEEVGGSGGVAFLLVVIVRGWECF